jgi:hypothetical protein
MVQKESRGRVQKAVTAGLSIDYEQFGSRTLGQKPASRESEWLAFFARYCWMAG